MEYQMSKPVKAYYVGLESEVRKEAELAAKTIRKCIKTKSENVFVIGDELTKVKDTLVHGQFEAWIKAELEITPQHARRFMNVSLKLKDQKEHYVRFEPTLLYDLASKKPNVIEDANALAQKGELSLEFFQSLKNSTPNKNEKLSKKFVGSAVKQISNLKEKLIEFIELFQKDLKEENVENTFNELTEACQSLSTQIKEVTDSIGGKKK
jgi:hypothetical protein